MTRRPKRKTPKRIALVNHKGGVGKTTLTLNLAAALRALGKVVLLVDADPQCNLTSHFIDDADVDDLLDRSDGPGGRTLWSGVRPMLSNEGDIATLKPLELYNGMYLVPGDIQLAQFEEHLGDAWGDCFRRRIRAIRETTGISRIVGNVAAQIEADYVFYDTGPNIGALNRTVVLDCSHFVTPVACDLFSLRAVKTLGHSLAGWINEWKTISALAPESEYLLAGSPVFAGYLPQGFRVYGGAITQNASKFITRIERQVRTEIVARMQGEDAERKAAAPLRLATIKHFGELVPAAQVQGVALWDADEGSPRTRQDANKAFRDAAVSLLERVG